MATSSSSSSHQDNPQKVQFPLDSAAYKNLQEIGSGDKAVVYKAVCVPMNSAIVAIKSVDLNQSTADFESILRDTKTLSLSHPNILSGHCSFTTADRRLWVVMPFMAFGSLQSIIISSLAFPQGLTEPCIAVFLKETLNAMSYLHGQGHVHGDIKPGNILVDSDGSVKLADFGVSASFYGADHSTGTSDTSATPDRVAPDGDGCKADIWAFGITAVELALGCPSLSRLPPLLECQIPKVKNKYPFSDYENIIKDFKTKKYSPAFEDLVGSCLDQDPAKRPAAETLLKHSFFHNCRGKNFLAETVLRRLESVEERFKKRNRGNSPVPSHISSSESSGSGNPRMSDFAMRLELQLQIVTVITGRLKRAVEMSAQDKDKVVTWKMKNELDIAKEDILQLKDNLKEFGSNPIFPAASSSTSKFPAKSSNGGNARLVEFLKIAGELEKHIENVSSIIDMLEGAGAVETLKKQLKDEYDTCLQFQVDLEMIKLKLEPSEGDQ